MDGAARPPKRTLRFLASVFAGLFLLGSAAAAEPQPPPAESVQTPPGDGQRLRDLHRRLEDLQQRIDDLEKQAPPKEEPQPSSREIQRLEIRTNLIESLTIGNWQIKGLAERGSGWSSRSGFFIQSADGTNFLRLTGFAQADYRAFPGGQTGMDPGTDPDTFSLRRMRPVFDGRLFRYYHFQIGIDFSGRTRSELLNAFVDLEYFNAARIRVGQFKANVNIEMTQGGADLVFIERSLVQNLNPYRDFGAQVFGRLFQERLRYDLGVLNGSPVGPGTDPNLSFSNDKMLFGRLWVSPFVRTDLEPIKQLQFGIGFTYGDVQNQTGQQPMQDEARARTIFQYASNVTGSGLHTRIVPFLLWYWHRLHVMSVYTSATEREKNTATGAAAALTHQAWMVQSTFLLTDDDASFTTVSPKRPLDVTRGQWGAWELAARYAELRLDPNTFSLGLADISTNIQRAKALSLGVNWYPVHNLKIQVHLEHNDFDGAGPGYVASGKSNALITRFSLKF
jgi:phosphate-selective porin OprO/OprP